MKARKRESHQNLIQDIFRNVQLFKPDILMIKNRIDALLEKEYIKRDDNDSHFYIYLP